MLMAMKRRASNRQLQENSQTTFVRFWIAAHRPRSIGLPLRNPATSYTQMGGQQKR